MNKWKKGIAAALILGISSSMLTGCSGLKAGGDLIVSYLQERQAEKQEKAELEKKEEEIRQKREERKKKEAEEEQRKEEEQKAREEKKKTEEEEQKKKEAEENKKVDLTSDLGTIVEKNQSSGDFSAYLYGLESGAAGSYDSHQMQAASLIKLYIAGSVYENWDTLVSLQSWDGELDSLLRNMITVSDNEASNNLIGKLGSGDAAAGMNVVNTYCQNHGFGDTHLGRLLLASNEYDDNYTSVNDCGSFLRAVYNGELAGSESILNLMRQQQRTGKIPAGIPAAVETANKTGELYNVENDAAVIWGTEPYILVIMSEKLSDAGSARYGIVNMSSDIYNLMETRSANADSGDSE